MFNLWLLSPCFLLLVSKCKVQKRKRIIVKENFIMGIFPFMEFINSRVKLIPFSCFQYTLFMCSSFYTVSSCAYTHITRRHFELTLTKHTSCLIMRHKLMLKHMKYLQKQPHTAKSQSDTNTHNKIQQQTPILKTQLLCNQLQTTIDLDRTHDWKCNKKKITIFLKV